MFANTLLWINLSKKAVKTMSWSGTIRKKIPDAAKLACDWECPYDSSIFCCVQK